jgi:hypothetical protein
MNGGEVQFALEEAAHKCGYVRDKGMPAARAAIRSAKRGGTKEPRPIPPDIIQDELDAAEGAVMKQRMRQGRDGVTVDEETGEVIHDPARAKPVTSNFAFPEHLTHVPGLVGEITKWITGTARQPCRVPSLAATGTLLGTVLYTLTGPDARRQGR